MVATQPLPSLLNIDWKAIAINPVEPIPVSEPDPEPIPNTEPGEEPDPEPDPKPDLVPELDPVPAPS